MGAPGGERPSWQFHDRRYSLGLSRRNGSRHWSRTPLLGTAHSWCVARSSWHFRNATHFRRGDLFLAGPEHLIGESDERRYPLGLSGSCPSSRRFRAVDSLDTQPQATERLTRYSARWGHAHRGRTREGNWSLAHFAGRFDSQVGRHAYQIGNRVCLHFLEDLVAMNLRRSFRDAEVVADLLV